LSACLQRRWSLSSSSKPLWTAATSGAAKQTGGTEMLFTDIVMINYSRPMQERAKARKVVGPYHWTPQQSPSKGFGFYQASRGMAMDRHGSIADLRIETANDHLEDHGYGSLSQINGYYTDEYCDQTLVPIIARLPRSRGFLAGWTMGAGMCASLDATIYATAEDAARAAHSEAEYTAECERERREDETDTNPEA
jgi:hypothetical protein